ncbi:MAG TPA: amidohydrolase family protein, partial [Flavitalea sp.]|nr:amidohydrolase family protein [Flavitalea sp.]
LTCYTVNAAYASFEENLKGSLEKGKLADFVVLERNILSIPPEEIRDVKVLLTVVGGKEAFKRKD